MARKLAAIQQDQLQTKGDKPLCHLAKGVWQKKSESVSGWCFQNTKCWTCPWSVKETAPKKKKKRAKRFQQKWCGKFEAKFYKLSRQILKSLAFQGMPVKIRQPVLVNSAGHSEFWQQEFTRRKPGTSPASHNFPQPATDLSETLVFLLF